VIVFSVWYAGRRRSRVAANLGYMAVDLTGTREKLKRALFHFKALHAEVPEWLAQAPIAFDMESNETSTEFLIRMRVEREITTPFLSWTLMIGDCISNTRAALDHMVYATAIADSGTNPPPMANSLAFPIVDNPRDFDFKDRRLGSLSDRVKAAIESVQPYHRRDETFAPLLSILRELSNADKHRLIKLAFVAPQKAKIKVVSPRPVNLKIDICVDELHPGSILAIIKLPEPVPDIHFGGVELALMLAIDHQIDGVDGSYKTRRSSYHSLLNNLMSETLKVTNIVAAAV
jgi:hypothetical protein